jgi:hypothetical protein
LVEQNRVKDLGIEKPAMGLLAAAARPAMKKNRRNALGVAILFHIKRMYGVHSQILELKGFRLGRGSGF